MRLLMLSDRMTGNSAYSKTTYEICTRLAKDGHKVAHVPMGFANRMGRTIDRDSRVLIYNSSSEDAYCEDEAVKAYIDFKADMLLVNKDPWVLQRLHRVALNLVPFAIIDHSPVSPHMTSRLQTSFRNIAVSRFAQRELKKKGIDSTYIPLGVRTDIFKPPPDKAECKKAFYMDPDSFVVGIVAMNRCRKMLPLMLRGYKRFCELNPDVRSHLFLWTNVRASRPPADRSLGVSDVGVNLLPEIYELGLGTPPNDVRWVKWEEVEDMGGLPDHDPTGRWDMQKLYGSFDVHLLCSGGEGAGLTYLEAAATGVPSVYTNYAAAHEYAGPTGIAVKAENYVILNTPGTRFYLADIDAMAEALTKLYNTDREKLAVKARRFAESLSWEKVMEKYWTPFLFEAAQELKPKIVKGGITTWD